jgi:hypothetical protein
LRSLLGRTAGSEAGQADREPDRTPQVGPSARLAGTSAGLR